METAVALQQQWMIKQAWNKCPCGHTPILLFDLNINLCSPQDKRDEKISKVFEV
jgi:hypothetical protein